VSTRATTSHQHVQDVTVVEPVRASTRRSRVRAWLTREQREEDGVFRPVRLPMWIDLGVSAAIVLAVAAMFAGFIHWLAQTQGR
jgi:hypothetical protein